MISVLLSRGPAHPCSPPLSSISSRLSVPGGFLGIGVHRGFISRAGHNLPQSTQLGGLILTISPMLGGCRLNNLRVSPWEPQQAWLLPGAAPPWVHQTLSWQRWTLHKQRGPEGPGVTGTTDPIHSFPTMGKIKSFDRNQSTCLTQAGQVGWTLGLVAEVGWEFGSLMDFILLYLNGLVSGPTSADVAPAPLYRPLFWGLLSDDRKSLSSCCLPVGTRDSVLERGKRRAHLLWQHANI